ncbi:MAG TPA: hypothetical protein VEB20_08930 [Azospirillaceae bacterium]|nr:hypothetical protein [Azospirillaceae bacterium]
MEPAAPATGSSSGAPPSDMLVRRFQALWSDRAGDRGCPAFCELDFAGPDWAPFRDHAGVMALVRQPFLIRYRYVGRELACALGVDSTGVCLEDRDYGEMLEFWLGIYERAIHNRRPLAGRHQMLCGGGTVWADWGVFPFAADGAAVDHLVELVTFDDPEAVRRHPVDRRVRLPRSESIRG